jgi:hypothetical protein
MIVCVVEPKVNSIEPTEGSMAGGTMVFIHGQGKCPNQISMQTTLVKKDIRHALPLDRP